jgi:hypothetical protein
VSEGQPLVVAWRQRDGMWRWRWVSSPNDDAQELVSNMAFESLDEARESAQEAYPGMRVGVSEETLRREHEERVRERHRERRRFYYLPVVVALVVARAVSRRRGRR